MLLISVFVFVSTLLLNPTYSFAFPSVLGAKVIGEQSVSIDGHQVEDPKTPVVADSAKPTFSGYTISNAKLVLIISDNPTEAETLSDADGSWLYTTGASIEPGQHTLSLKVTDDTGIESEETLVATFIIPEVKGSQTTSTLGNVPLPKTPIINYLSITLIVLGSLTVLGTIYAFFNRRPQ